MSFVIRRCIQLYAMFAATVCSFSAQAGYDFTIIDPPDSIFSKYSESTTPGMSSVTRHSSTGREVALSTIRR